MAGKIPRAFIDELLVRVDIIDLIDSYVPLKKSGHNYVACCPFHAEKTPSFSATRSKQFYHCFGCGAGGNAISFLIEYNHLNFVEAVEALADFIGVEVPRETTTFSNAPKDDITEIFRVLALTAEFYRQQLQSHASHAMDYLNKRALSADVIERYQLGYAPEQWDNLSKKAPLKSLIAAGLVAKKENQGSYDRFRGRIIFPIRDRRGRIIGFGGRILTDTQPKYLNSPETAVFHKNREVYGLYEALKYAAKPERLIVVEGYLDVIALAQFDISYAVATLGTAVSKEHIELLFRFSREIVLCFDGDKAGREATWRGVLAALPALKEGRQISIMQLPTGIDPDDYVREKGNEAFIAHIDSAQSLSDYFFKRLSQGLNLQSMEGRANLVSKAKGYLNTLPSGIFQDLMLEKLKSLTQIKQLNIIEPINQRLPSQRKQTLADQSLSPVRLVISLLLQNLELITEIEQQNIDWTQLNIAGIDLLQRIVEIISMHPDINLPRIIEYFRGQPEEKYINIMMNHDFFLSKDALQQEFLGAIDRLITQGKENNLNVLIEKERNTGLSEQEQSQLVALLGSLK